METVLYLVRHGATPANLQDPPVLQGRHSDPPLADLGVRQARAAAEFLKVVRLDAAFSSPLRRAEQTARAIAELHALDVQTVEALTEVDVGRWEGKTWARISGEDPRAYEAFMADSSANPYAGGESFADVRDRVAPAIDAILDSHVGRAVLVVAHNTVNRAYLAGLLGVPIGKARRLSQANGGINVIRRRDGQTKLITLNGVFHLAGLEMRD